MLAVIWTRRALLELKRDQASLDIRNGRACLWGLADLIRLFRQPYQLSVLCDSFGEMPSDELSQRAVVQPETAGYLRDVELDVVQTPARLDRILVFGPGGGQLSAERPQLDLAGLLTAAGDVVPRQQQVAVVQGEAALESRDRHLADTADLRAGHTCRAVQLYSMAVLLFRFRSDATETVVLVRGIVGNVHHPFIYNRYTSSRMNSLNDVIRESEVLLSNLRRH